MKSGVVGAAGVSNEGGKRDRKGKNAMERDRARESKHV